MQFKLQEGKSYHKHSINEAVSQLVSRPHSVPHQNQIVIKFRAGLQSRRTDETEINILYNGEMKSDPPVSS